MKKYLILAASAIVIIIITTFVLLSSESSQFNYLDTKTFNQNLSSNNYILLDIRTVDEFNEGHIKGAKQIDYYQTQAFSDYLDTLDKSKKYLIYCRTGRRTGLALNLFKQKGFTNVSDLKGGYNSWLASDLPTEK